MISMVASQRPRIIAGYVLAWLGIVVVIVSFFLPWEQEYYADQPLAAQQVFTYNPWTNVVQTYTNMQTVGFGPGPLIFMIVLIWGPPVLLLLSVVVAMVRKHAAARTGGVIIAMVGLLIALFLSMVYRTGFDDSGRVHVLVYGGFVAYAGYVSAMIGLLLLPRAALSHPVA